MLLRCTAALIIQVRAAPGSFARGGARTSLLRAHNAMQHSRSEQPMTDTLARPLRASQHSRIIYIICRPVRARRGEGAKDTTPKHEKVPLPALDQREQRNRAPWTIIWPETTRRNTSDRRNGTNTCTRTCCCALVACEHVCASAERAIGVAHARVWTDGFFFLLRDVGKCWNISLVRVRSQEGRSYTPRGRENV